MSYSTTNPPHLLTGSVGNRAPNLWAYQTTSDPLATIASTGYISNAKALGMKIGDVLLIADLSSSTGLFSQCLLTNVTTGGTAMRCVLVTT